MSFCSFSPVPAYIFQIIFRMDGNILREEQSGPFTSKNVRYVDNGQLVYVRFVACIKKMVNYGYH